jgi:phytoene dehydrogenase-like protein
MKKKIIIIGAGIGGLSAGCYGQINDYETEIFEMHSIPGGICTSWNRKGYLIDGSIDWLVGTNPDSILYDYWNEIGALEGKKFVYHDYVMQVEGDFGKRVILYSDIDKLENHLIELSPIDSVLIKEFTDAVRNFAPFSKTAKNIMNDKFIKMTLHDFLSQFKDSFLREALSVCLLPLNAKEYPVGALILKLSFYNRKDACWPIGGSLEFAKGIEKKYLSLGGKTFYKSKVEEIITKNEEAVGVRLSDGSEHYADYVISTVDAHRTVFDFLKGRFINDEIKDCFNINKDLLTSMQVSLGINCNLSNEPHSITKKLHEPLIIGDRINTHISFKHFSYDNTICKSSKSVITSIIPTDYKFWKSLYKAPEEYKAEKERIAMKFIETIEERFSEIKGKIDVVDVATPVTYTRYTGVWKGAYMGGVSVPSVLPGLNHFYMAGQWTKPTGSLPVTMMTGKECIEKISAAGRV